MGHADVVVLSYGSTTRADLKNKRRLANLNFGARGPVGYEVPYGHTIIGKYAMARTPPHARVRHHPRAAGRGGGVRPATTPDSTPMPTTGIRSPWTTCSTSRMIADPFTKLHCCIRSDGGCAVVLAAEDRIPDSVADTGVGPRATAST